MDLEQYSSQPTTYLRQKWTDLRQTKTKMISCPLIMLSNTYHQRKCCNYPDCRIGRLWPTWIRSIPTYV